MRGDVMSACHDRAFRADRLGRPESMADGKSATGRPRDTMCHPSLYRIWRSSTLLKTPENRPFPIPATCEGGPRGRDGSARMRRAAAYGVTSDGSGGRPEVAPPAPDSAGLAGFGAAARPTSGRLISVPGTNV